MIFTENTNYDILFRRVMVVSTSDLESCESNTLTDIQIHLYAGLLFSKKRGRPKNK